MIINPLSNNISTIYIFAVLLGCFSYQLNNIRKGLERQSHLNELTNYCMEMIKRYNNVITFFAFPSNYSNFFFPCAFPRKVALYSSCNKFHI